ncbi:hypothetical protein DV735_g3318, partial [Chaetothyriales sp. CBS 134920]
MLRRLPPTPCPGPASAHDYNGNDQDQDQDYGNNTTANLDFTTEFKASFRNSLLMASPKKGCRPQPLGTSTRTVQAARAASLGLGSGPGKENVPPGYVMKLKEGDEGRNGDGDGDLMILKKPRSRPHANGSKAFASTSNSNSNSRSIASAKEDISTQQQTVNKTPAQQIKPKPKPSVPSRLVVPLVKVESSSRAINKSFPLLPEGLPQVSLYEDNWLGQQEYNKADIALMHKRVQGALLYGSLSIPQQQQQQHRLYDDLGRRKAFTDLWLETYDGELIKTALEVVTGRAISSTESKDVSRLKKRLKLFIDVFLIRNEDGVADDHGQTCSSSSPSSPSLSLSAYTRTLLRSLMLIKVLDLAKTEPGLASTTARPLFLATSPYKTSSSVLQALMRMLNPSAGDPVRALAHLGYTVTHEQHALEEYDYQVTNLAVDLRDGVRLARLVELLLYRSADTTTNNDNNSTTIVLTSTHSQAVLARDWPLSQQLKVPCMGRAAKLFNVQISLTALAAVKALEPVLCDISADDIVDGFREKTMKLLWALTSKWGLEGLLDWNDVRGEIVRLGRAAGKVGYHSCFARRAGVDQGDDDESDSEKAARRRYAKHKALLQEWAKSVAALHGLAVRNLTTSFADGRVFEAIVDQYTPYLPSRKSDSQARTRPCLSDRLKALGCGDQFAELFATGPGAAGKHHIFDPDFTLASLAFLCSRLLGPSKTARAATVLQRAWRGRMQVVGQQRKAVLQQRRSDIDSSSSSTPRWREVDYYGYEDGDGARSRDNSAAPPAYIVVPPRQDEVEDEVTAMFDDRDDRLRDRNAWRDGDRGQRQSSERPSYRSERFLSVPDTVVPLNKLARSRSTSISRDSEQRRPRDSDDGGRSRRAPRLSRASDDGGRSRRAPRLSRASDDGGSRRAPRRLSGLSLVSTAIPEFRHRPLSPDVKQAIRVLRVRPDLVMVDDQGLIACDLEHSSITQARYSTVSYAWGDPDDATRRILVDGGVFRVRRNLYELLRHLRQFHAGKAIWIDAITINQADLDEKSRQVQMMSRIYAGTSEVLVWLGPRVDHVGHTIRCMLEYEDMTDYAKAVHISRDETFWRGFRAINTALYWNRVWVIQEFVTPKAGRIIQGDRWVGFGCFQQTIRLFDTRVWRWALKPTVFWGRRADDFSEYISNIHPLWQRRIDIRDRVYGIMPLATHGSTLRVDYRLNPFEVLLESIWLEHNSHMDRTDVLMNLANILLLTPASICIYAQKKTSRAESHLKRTSLPRDRRGTEELHVRAAASPVFQADWIRAATSNDDDITWRNFAVDQRFKLPKNALSFPSRRQCPWTMFVYTSTGSHRNSGSTNIGLKLAIDSRAIPPDERDTSPHDFIHANKKKSLALGVYRTTCAPYPFTIYYALTDRLEDTKKGGHNSAMFGGALQGLDLDGLDI